MKHLKLFDDAASYEVWKNGEDYVTPSVSYVEENNTIIFYEAEESLLKMNCCIIMMEQGLKVL